ASRSGIGGGRWAAVRAGSSSTARRSNGPAGWRSTSASTRAWTRWQTAAASIPGLSARRIRLGFAPHRKLAARGVNELEAAPAREGEDRLGNNSTGRGDRVERGFEVV